MASTHERSISHDERRYQAQAKLLAAIEHLTAAGESLTNVSVERLASAAGISRATFYIYFADKADLLQAWLQETVDELREAGSDWWKLDRAATRGDLRAVLARLISVYRSRAGVMTAVYAEPSVREQVSGLAHYGIGKLQEHIERGQAEGFIDADLLPAETASWIGWMFERALTHVFGPASEDEVDPLLDALSDLLWTVLYTGAARRSTALTARSVLRVVRGRSG